MASSVKCRAKRAPSPDSADRVKSSSSAANSSLVMSPSPMHRRGLVGPTLSYLQFETVFGTRRKLFRGFRHHRQWHAGQPAIEELLQPGALGDVVDRAAGEMLGARAGSRQGAPLLAARGSAMHHRVGHVGMKLETERMA